LLHSSEHAGSAVTLDDEQRMGSRSAGGAGQQRTVLRDDLGSLVQTLERAASHFEDRETGSVRDVELLDDPRPQVAAVWA
jgi:hypothetical protein